MFLFAAPPPLTIEFKGKITLILVHYAHTRRRNARRVSDPQFDSALRDLIEAGGESTSGRTHLLSSLDSHQRATSAAHNQVQHSGYHQINSGARPHDLDHVFNAYQRAKDRIERLTVSVQ